jgi:hypothetical protein
MQREFQHQSQDSRQSLAEQILEQYHRQTDAERKLEREATDQRFHLRDAA